LRDDTFRSLPHNVAEEYLLQDGDILFARSGATVGKTFIYSIAFGPACFAGYLIRVRVNTMMCTAEWLYMYSQTAGYWGYVGGSQIQATTQNVSAEKYANMRVPIPPIEEQRYILSHLVERLREFDELGEESRRTIVLLQERRAALISAAVIGKIDVRGLKGKEAA
jgi:type I restriction enzyme S subunit